MTQRLLQLPVSVHNTQRKIQTCSTEETLKNYDVLLTVHLSIFILVINQLDAQNFVLQKIYFISLHVSSTCAHHQEVKIALHSLWYHHTEASELSKITTTVILDHSLVSV